MSQLIISTVRYRQIDKETHKHLFATLIRQQVNFINRSSDGGGGRNGPHMAPTCKLTVSDHRYTFAFSMIAIINNNIISTKPLNLIFVSFQFNMSVPAAVSLSSVSPILITD